MPHYWFEAFEVDGDFVIAVIRHGNARWEVAATVITQGASALLRGFHMQGAGANTTGAARLRAMALWAKDELGVEELRIEGAARTSGACPGRKPACLVF